MKREWRHYRGTALPAKFVRPNAEDHLNFELSARTGQQSPRTKTIFVIKKTSQLSSTNAAGKKIRRILIFDNHPDSLRLVFGRRPLPDVDLIRSKRVGSLELILVSIVTVAGLLGMFWPLLRIFAP
jgi:hypothetical protein